MPNLEIKGSELTNPKVVVIDKQDDRLSSENKTNNSEIGVFMTESAVNSEKELSQGLTVERTQTESANQNYDTRTLKQLKSDLEEEQKLLQIYKKDLQNGTSKGLSRNIILGAAGIGAAMSLAFFFLTAPYGMLTLQNGLKKFSELSENKQLFAGWCHSTGVLATFGAMCGGVYKAIVDSPKNRKHKEYVSELPHMIRVQEQKIKDLEELIMMH